MAETIGLIILGGLESVGVVESAAALGATTIFGSLTVATAVGATALLGVSVAVAFATRPDVPKPSDGSQPIKQAIPPRPFGYGRCRLAGAYMLYEVDPSTKASWDVLAFHQGKIEAIVGYYLNDDLVALNDSGVVDDVLNAPSNDQRYGVGTASTLVTIKANLGLDTETAFADVIAAVPTLWTSAHRGDGVASFYMKCAQVSPSSVLTFYPRGLPRPSVIADLSPIWDPRDEAQDPDDPDTWAVSSNPVLQLLDYLTNARTLGLSYADLIEPVIDAWMAQADICDESVNKLDGSTEPRYKSDGWAFLSTDPAEIIAALLATCDGWLAENGDGTLTLKVGKYSAPSVTFTDDHILGFSIDKGVPDEEFINEMQFSYNAPEGHYKEGPGVAFRDETSISEVGRVKSQSLTLAWVQSHAQGRRLAKRALARAQATVRGQIVTNLYGIKGLGERWIGVQSRTITDLSDAVIEISGKAQIDLANGRITYDFTLVNTNTIDAWDETTEEGDPPSYFPEFASLAVTDNGGGTHKIKVQFTAPDPSTDWLEYILDYRLGSSGAWTREIIASLNEGGGYTVSGGKVTILSSAVGAGTYQVRVAARPPEGITPNLVWAPNATTGSSIAIA
jgi:hypothetical protein